jgi:PAS domain S-box-containing protein
MALRWPLWPVLGGDLAFLFLWPSVVLCAWYGGLGPGLLAAALSAASAAFFLLVTRPSPAAADAADLLGLAVFTALSAALALLCEQMHRANRRAAADRDRFRTLFENTQDALLLADDQAHYLDANPAACELVGLTREELRRRTVWDVTPAPNGEAGRRAWREFLAEGRQAGEYRLRRPDGRVIDVEYRAVAHVQPGVHLSALRDITERLRLEGELRLRVAELAEADRRKTDFMAVLAHELRGPLAPVRISAHALRLLGGSDPRVAEAAAVVERQAGQMARLVDDLLDASRVGQGKLRLRKETVDLATVLGQATEACRPALERKGQALSVSLPAGTVLLEADPARLAQVFGNLLTNAAKYTDPGGRVWLSAEADGRGVAVRVRDSGVGIAPELLPRVFELFAQAGGDRDRSEGGLGIGLAVVKGLVELHGGTVEAHSEGPGRGAVFVVRLPSGAGGPE